MTANMSEPHAHERRGVMLLPRDEIRLVREFFQSRRGYFVDVGANDPTDWSQTFHLEQLGWDGVLIEPQPELAQALREQRKVGVQAVACSSPENSGRSMPLKLAGAYSTLSQVPRVVAARIAGTIDVPIKTLDEVLTEVRAPSPIDFLSIDVEGHERDVLRGFDLARWRPRLILIEDHVLDRGLHSDLVSRGYAWIRRTGLNSWYVPAATVPRIGAYGNWQFVRKYYLGVPIRRLREAVRRLRRRAKELGAAVYA
jgi:FkbM family methyltransferase